MDYIKKIICLEGARTRTQGLMPYYEFGKGYRQHKQEYDRDGKPICSGKTVLNLESADGPNGNWGQFVANPCFLSKEGKTYESVLRKYYEILNMVRSGVKLRKVEFKDGDIIFTEDVGAFEWNDTRKCFSGGTEPDSLYEYAAYDANDFNYGMLDSFRDETKRIYRSKVSVSHDFIVLIKDFEKFKSLVKYLIGVRIPQNVINRTISGDEHTNWVDYCMIVDALIGKINIPAKIYNKHLKTPKSMPCADVEPYIKWLEDYPNLSGDCCNRRLWEDMGGDEMLTELKKHRGECRDRLEKLEGLEFTVPYIEMPILLTQCFTDVGVLTNIDGVEYDSGATYGDGDGKRPHGKGSPTGITIDEIIMGTGITTDSSIEVESLLETLRSPKKYSDDKDNLLPGLFQKFSNPAGQMFVCVKKSDGVFYRLQVSAQTIVDGVVVNYCLKYVADSGITMEEFEQHCNDNNIVQTIPGTYLSNLSLEDAVAELARQEQMYNESDTDNKYVLCYAVSVWEMEELNANPRDSVNADGLTSEQTKYTHQQDPNYRVATNKLFRTITTEAAGIRIAQTEEEEMSAKEGHHGDKDGFLTHYYFVVKYDNTAGTPMTIPYEVGNTANIYYDPDKNRYRGDIITSVVSSTTSGVTYIEVTYVIGGYLTSGANGYSYSYGGDTYREKHILDKNHVDYVALDGVDNVPVYSEYVDFGADEKEFYSPRYNLYRTGNTATIVKMTTGDVWNRDYESDYFAPYDAYLTKEEYLTAFSMPPKTDVNVTIDRGGVSAFEKHYKLAECNTMQDLVDYGNNFFNL